MPHRELPHRPRRLPPARPAGAPSLLPLGALAAGFGLFSAEALAQVAPAAPAASAARSASAKEETTLKPISVKAKAETDKDSVRATTSTIGKGVQELRDIPQSVTIVTEKLIQDRRIDTVKEALHQTAGITFQAAEGGEEDVRLRGFSLATTGDIFVDGVRDPAFYDRDVFSFDRVELLRGSASMLFGRGSTGGVVNQVSKVPVLANVSEVTATVGSGSYMRGTGDFNIKLGDTSAVRINTMFTEANNYGNKISKYGVAPALRFGIGTPDEITVSAYALDNDNGINYGIPWLRVNAASANPSGLVDINPKNYYGAASDYNAGSASYLTVDHVHRFAGEGRLHTTVRNGFYDRDQRASTIRFCVRTVNAAGVVSNPDCPSVQPTQSTIDASTPLVRGTNNKVQNLHTTYAQSDYSNALTVVSMRHELLTGIDLAHERFQGFQVPLPAGVVLDKNSPRPTLGAPNDGTSVDESRRIKRLASDFDAKALGIYVQDLVQVAPSWKILGGLRWDHFEGSYRTFSTAASATVPVIGTQTADRSRTDTPLSKRVGVLFQPTDYASFHFSYGTSFNTSGDTYQYDDQTANTPPESSENLELGAKVDLFDGRLSTRVAAFRTTKLHERNRDPDSAATAALLSGKRHAAGIELDLAGRLTARWEVYGSYAWTPVARIDVGAPGSVPGVGEGEGTRSSLTPRHSGTIWSTYQLTERFRFGAGLNARSSQTPNRNPAGIVAPRFVTGDLLAEYAFSEQIAFKFNLLNVTNKLYADSLYTGHYIPGQPRTFYVTMAARF